MQGVEMHLGALSDLVLGLGSLAGAGTVGKCAASSRRRRKDVPVSKLVIVLLMLGGCLLLTVVPDPG
jgi:hypothetical protein